MTKRRAFIAGLASVGLVGSAKAQQEQLDWDCQWTSNIDADEYQLINLGGLSGTGITEGNEITTLLGGPLTVEDDRLIPRRPRVGLDSTAAQTIVGSGDGDARVDNPSTINNPRHFEHVTESQIRYIGDWTEEINITGTLSLSGANTTGQVSLARNGTVLDRTRVSQFASNATDPFNVTTTSVLTLEPQDTVSMFLQNVDGSTDLTVEKYAMTV
ncbi:MAG: hypothetical protein HQRvContig01_61 [Haloquadratum phage sp.]|nr:MAG: hypothetical protein HQRvContig01_61 [Haloquadratum phage sp.]